MLRFAWAIVFAAVAFRVSTAAPRVIWYASADDPDDTDYRDFTISTSPTAYLTLTTNYHMFWATDSANVAALFADMTNGVNNPLTFSTSTFEYTVDEDYFFNETYLVNQPLTGYTPDLELFTPRPVDLAGWTIDSINVNRGTQRLQRRYYVAVIAQFTAPEPASATLLLFGMCGVLFRRRRTFCRRTSKTVAQDAS